MRSKERKEIKQKTYKEGLGPSEVALRTWPLNPPKKNTKIQKLILFDYQSNFSFLVGVQNFPFWQLVQQSAHPKNTMKIGVSADHFLKNRCATRTGHFFGQKKPKPEIPDIIFLPVPFSFNKKNHKNWLKPRFLWCFCKPKKEIFPKLNLKQRKLAQIMPLTWPR